MVQEHRVHKVEVRNQENGEPEEELVVSNLRPFTLKAKTALCTSAVSPDHATASVNSASFIHPDVPRVGWGARCA